jgi:glycine cleavage system H protein
MNIPEDLLYTRSHEWVRLLADGTVRVGLTDHAQNEMGELVYANLPRVGDSVSASQPFGEVESVKAISQVYSPVTGIITAVNEALADTPELINQYAYGAWLIQVQLSGQLPNLLDAAGYTKELLAGEA